jgi:hypothetical protein
MNLFFRKRKPLKVDPIIDKLIIDKPIIDKLLIDKPIIDFKLFRKCSGESSCEICGNNKDYINYRKPSNYICFLIGELLYNHTKLFTYLLNNYIVFNDKIINIINISLCKGNLEFYNKILNFPKLQGFLRIEKNLCDII